MPWRLFLCWRRYRHDWRAQPLPQLPPIRRLLEIDGRRALRLGRLKESVEVEEHLRAMPADQQVVLNPAVLLGSQLIRLVSGQRLHAGVVLRISPMAAVLGQKSQQIVGARCLVHYGLPPPFGPSSGESPPSLSISRFLAWCRWALTVSMEIFITIAISWYLRPLS